jgi:hypothetical protein
MPDLCRDDFENAALSGRSSVGAEKPVPEEIDDREIVVRVAVVNEVQLLLAAGTMRISEGATPPRGILYQERRGRRTTLHIQPPAPRRDITATRKM